MNASTPTRRAAPGALTAFSYSRPGLTTAYSFREASAMLERPYRQPWDAVLRGLIA